jgi:hypothetical protein
MNRLALFFLLFPLSAWAAEQTAEKRDCLPHASFPVCRGDTVFARTEDNKLRVGTLTGWSEEDLEFVEVDGEKFSVSDTATLSPSYCTEFSTFSPSDPYKMVDQKICVGDAVAAGNQRGVVLALSPHGGQMILTAPGKVARILETQKGVVRKLEKKELPQVSESLRGLARINELLGQPGLPATCLKEELTKNAWPRKAIDRSLCKVEPPPSPFPRKAHFQSLLLRGESAPLEEFLQLWNPGDDRPIVDKALFSCEKSDGGTLRFDGPGKTVSAKCHPDALYSWGPPVKTKNLQKELADGARWEGFVNDGRNIYASNSAASTFGYGEELVRLKVRKDALFQSTWHGTEPGEIGVRDDVFHDFVVRDSDLIESWSYGTPEIYDEVVRDVLRYKSGKRVTVYSEHGLKERPAKGLARLWAQAEDGYAQDEAGLKRRLLRLIQTILSGEGGVFYPEDLCPSRASHYKPNRPSYINPN